MTLEPLTVTRIDCPELPERERWRLARGEHGIATFPTEAEAVRFLRMALAAAEIKHNQDRAWSAYAPFVTRPPEPHA